MARQEAGMARKGRDVARQALAVASVAGNAGVSDSPEYAPVKLDAKDKRIIAELFNDGRIPLSVVGRKIRLSKESVSYRVRRLVKSGLLVGFNTVLDVKRLGWEIFFVYIRFRNIDSQRERQLLDFLKSHPNVAQLFRCIGNYDAIIKVFVKSYADVREVMKGIEGMFRESMDDYAFDYIIEETAVPFSFIYDVKASPFRYYYRGKESRVSVSGVDLSILRAIAKDARVNFASLASRLRLSRDLIKYRVKKLEKDKIILKYRPDTLPKVLGYNWYFLTLRTGKLSAYAEGALSSFLLSHPHVTYFYRTAGVNDVQVELRVKTNEKLNEILTQIRGVLKGSLKRFELLAILDEPKYTYFPECMMEK